MSERDLVRELAAAASDREDDLGALLVAAADRIEGQSAELDQLKHELEETNEGMVALTVELQDAEQRYRSLFENAVEGIYRTAGDSREYVMANGAMASILGYDDPETLQSAVGDVREDVFVDPKRYDEYVSRLESDDRIEGFEYRIERADGEVRWVADNARLLYEDGDPAGYRGGVVDITERREYEQRLETRTEELEALNRLLRHDIANDMQIIRGFAEHLRENVGEQFRPQAAQIVETTDHVLQLTEDARAFVETITGQDDPQLEPTPVAEMLAHVLERQRDAHPEATFEVVEEIPAVTVRANELLSSVFRNILTNAVDHNDTDSPTVEVAVGVDSDEGAVVARFSDDGPGVPDDRKAEIFGKGEQSVDSEGTGIGLYLVNELVDSYGGEVSVEDRPDGERGAVFVVRLPLART